MVPPPGSTHSVSTTRLRVTIALLLVFVILLVATLAGDVLVNQFVHPRTYFLYLVISTAMTGISTSLLVEKMGVRILE